MYELPSQPGGQPTVRKQHVCRCGHYMSEHSQVKEGHFANVEVYDCRHRDAYTGEQDCTCSRFEVGFEVLTT